MRPSCPETGSNSGQLHTGNPLDDRLNKLENDRLLRALRKQPVDRTPVWLMRQAGRYLPEYRETRKKAGSFMDLCRNDELACEVTLQPLARYPLDAAIMFSDILTIPDAMGLGLQFAEGRGPFFDRPVRCAADIDRLGVPDPESDLGYVMRAVRLIRRELNGKVPLIGFSGSPWTLATYMVEGGSSSDYRRIKGMMFDQPVLLHRLLDVLTKSVTAYLRAQVAAGAQTLMVFDTWGGVLDPARYQQFSLAYMTQIVAGVRADPGAQDVPMVLFSKGAHLHLEAMALSGADALGIDWTIGLDEARRRVGGQVALQGNLDPTALYASPERIRSEVGRVLGEFGPGEGHVFNLGHGLQPHMDPEHVGACVRAVHELSAPFHTDLSARAQP